MRFFAYHTKMPEMGAEFMLTTGVLISVFNAI